MLTLNGGQPGGQGWPTGKRLASYEDAATTVVAHPDDAGVRLGAVGALKPGVADAVVSRCRLGSTQIPLEGLLAEDHVEVRLIDMEDANLDAAAVMNDAAEAVRVLLSEGKTVLSHCVHAETRTPLVAAAYGALITGSSASAALTRVLEVLPNARPRASLRAVLEASGCWPPQSTSS